MGSNKQKWEHRILIKNRNKLKWKIAKNIKIRKKSVPTVQAKIAFKDK